MPSWPGGRCLVPECRRPEPCGCWGCVSEWVERNKATLGTELLPWQKTYLQGIWLVEGVEGDGECG